MPKLKSLFKGTKFVITGAVPGYTRKAFQTDVLEKLGGTLASGVSKNVDFLITERDDSGSSKLAKARALGVVLVTGEWLVDSLQAGKVLPVKKYLVDKEESDSEDDEEEDEDDDEEKDMSDEEESSSTPDRVKHCLKTNAKHLKDLFGGMKFAITGTVPHFTRKQFQADVLGKCGGAFASGVSKNVDVLLTTAEQIESGDTSKIDKARSLGISILSYDWVTDAIVKGAVPDYDDYLLEDEGAAPAKKTSANKKRKKVDGDDEGEDDVAPKAKKSKSSGSTTKKNGVKASSKSSSKLFKGKVFVISGKIPDYTRAEFKSKFITGLGATLGSSVTKATSCVVTTEDHAASGDTAKLDAARAKGVPVVSYEYLVDCVEEGEVLDTEDFEI